MRWSPDVMSPIVGGQEWSDRVRMQLFQSAIIRRSANRRGSKTANAAVRISHHYCCDTPGIACDGSIRRF